MMISESMVFHELSDTVEQDQLERSRSESGDFCLVDESKSETTVSENS